jgi:hypothetical protein
MINQPKVKEKMEAGVLRLSTVTTSHGCTMWPKLRHGIDHQFPAVICHTPFFYSFWRPTMSQLYALPIILHNAALPALVGD